MPCRLARDHINLKLIWKMTRQSTFPLMPQAGFLKRALGRVDQRLILLSFLVFGLTGIGLIPLSIADQSYQDRLDAFPIEGVPLAGAAEIFWDKHQIPFIHAADDRDIPFLLGMIHAHLRLGQMEMMRRVAEGRISEMFGPFTSDIDHGLRILDYGRATQDIIRMLPRDTRAWVERYAAGINFYRAQSPSLSPDLSALGIKDEPWTIASVVTLGRLGATDVNWLYWFANLRLKKEPHWQEVWERLVAYGKTSIPSFSTADGAPLQLLHSMVKSGSNSYAVAGSRTASGSSLIANDPHLGLMLPNLWVLVGYKSPSYHVVGLSIPGLPVVLVGRNPTIAWGGTNMLSMSTTLYDISAESYRPVEKRQEVIRVRWWFNHKVTIRRSELGPVISDSKYFKDLDLPRMAIKWRGHEPSDELTAFLKVNRAGSWQAFRSAWESYAVSGQNMIYADRYGNIGQVMAVEFVPAAAAANARLIADPANPQHRWSERFNSLQLPAVFNPDAGVLVSTNNIPVKMEPPVSLFANSNDRYQAILSELQRSHPVTLDDLKRIQTNVYSGTSHKLARTIAGIEEPYSDRAAKLIEQLAGWDGNYTLDSSGAAALELAAYHLASKYYKLRYGDKTAEYVMRSPAVYTFLIEDLNDPTMTSLFAHAIDHAARDLKKYPTWGKMHYLRLRHPLGNMPLIGSAYRFGEYPVPGSTNTVIKRAHPLTNRKHFVTYGANARHVSDLSDLDENFFVLVGGQDGFIGSENFLDLFRLWQQNAYVRFPMRLDTIRATFTHRSIINAKAP